MRAQRSLSVALTTCSLFASLLVTRAQAAPDTDARAGGNNPAVSLAASARAQPKANDAQPAAKPVSPGAKSAGGATPGPEEHTRKLRAALAGLSSADPGAIQQSLVTLQELGVRAAAEGIATRLKAGMPPQLTEQALEVLGALHQPLAAPVLSELTLHRRWQIREKAVSALGALRMRSSVSVLLYALDDPSAEVRSAAARALGMVGDPRATAALNAALERGVEGALEGLAQLATNKQVDAILARAKGDLKKAEPALWLMLARTNLPAVSKLKVIDFVKAHDATAESANMLALWQERARQSGDRRLAAALAAKPGATGKAAPQVTSNAAADAPRVAQSAAPTSKGAKP